MYAGGMLYFSSGSVRSGLGVDVCPEAVASEASEARQINTCSRLAVSRRLNCVGSGHGGTAPWLELGLVAEAVDDLIRWSVVEAVPPSVARATYGGPREAIHDSQIRISNRRAGALPLVHDSNLVEKYSANVW
jgi:hypothetical protein